MLNLASFWKPEACGQTELPDRSVFNRSKIGGKCQNWKIQMRHFGWFSNIVLTTAGKAKMMPSYENSLLNEENGE